MTDTLNNTTTIKFKIGLCQLTVSSNKKQNIVRAQNAIKVAVDQGAALVVLPEMWNCPYSPDFFAEFAENFNNTNDSPSFLMLSQAASSYGITIVGGAMPEIDSHNGKIYNSCGVFGSNGSQIAKHRKLHLFDIDIPGDILFKESDSFAPGENATIVDTDVGRIGVGLCHDIRFPELAMLYRAKGAHLICYPGAFNMSTGELLWELVQRGRAVDNQLFVATCSPSRYSDGSYTIWGHSTLVGPFGEIITTCGHQETVLVAEIDYSEIGLHRESIPLEKQRREDMSQLVDMSEQQEQKPL